MMYHDEGTVATHCPEWTDCVETVKQSFTMVCQLCDSRQLHHTDSLCNGWYFWCTGQSFLEHKDWTFPHRQ